MEKAAVTNAADRTQVERAGKRVENERLQELNDIRTVLSTASGRRLLWRFMERCKTFSTVWEPSAKIHYNAGQQDVGHFIMAEIMEADANVFSKMMKEHKGKENDNAGNNQRRNDQHTNDRDSD
jgi:hypothetical protein